MRGKVSLYFSTHTGGCACGSFHHLSCYGYDDDNESPCASSNDLVLRISLDCPILSTRNEVVVVNCHMVLHQLGKFTHWHISQLVCWTEFKGIALVVQRQMSHVVDDDNGHLIYPIFLRYLRTRHLRNHLKKNIEPSF